MKKIYMSGALFSLIERHFNRALKNRIEKELSDVKVILPQDFRTGENLNDRRHLDRIFRQCMAAIGEADVVLAVLDGPDVDSGVAFEIGAAYRAGIPVVGIRTDYRNQQLHGLNLMVDCSLTERVSYLSFGEDMDVLVGEISRKLKKVLAKKTEKPARHSEKKAR